MKTTSRVNINHLENSNFLHFVREEIYFCRHGVAILFVTAIRIYPNPSGQFNIRLLHGIYAGLMYLWYQPMAKY